MWDNEASHHPKSMRSSTSKKMVQKGTHIHKALNGFGVTYILHMGQKLTHTKIATGLQMYTDKAWTSLAKLFVKILSRNHLHHHYLHHRYHSHHHSSNLDIFLILNLHSSVLLCATVVHIQEWSKRHFLASCCGFLGKNDFLRYVTPFAEGLVRHLILVRLYQALHILELKAVHRHDLHDFVQITSSPAYFWGGEVIHKPHAVSLNSAQRQRY